MLRSLDTGFKFWYWSMMKTVLIRLSQKCSSIFWSVNLVKMAWLRDTHALGLRHCAEEGRFFIKNLFSTYEQIRWKLLFVQFALRAFCFYHFYRAENPKKQWHSFAVAARNINPWLNKFWYDFWWSTHSVKISSEKTLRHLVQ